MPNVNEGRDGSPADLADLIDMRLAEIAFEKASRFDKQQDDMRSYEHPPEGDWPVRRLLADIYRRPGQQILAGLHPLAYLRMICGHLLEDQDCVFVGRPAGMNFREAVEVIGSVACNLQVVEIDYSDPERLGRELGERNPKLIYLADPVELLDASRVTSLISELGRTTAWVVEDTSLRWLTRGAPNCATLSEFGHFSRHVHLGGFAQLRHPVFNFGFVIVPDAGVRTELADRINLHMIFPPVPPQRCAYFYILEHMSFDTLL